MLFNFLAIFKAIKELILTSDAKAFKNKAIIPTEKEIKNLKAILKILSIFIKATTKLQADKYPTIYYIVPFIYQIYKRLDEVKEEYNVSTYLFYSLLKL